MKDYERYILWLDYFDSSLKRREGRRVPLNLASKSPSLTELLEACRKLSLEPVASEARYPRAFWKSSGYVSVKKTGPKQKVLVEVAKALSALKGKKKG